MVRHLEILSAISSKWYGDSNRVSRDKNKRQYSN